MLKRSLFLSSLCLAASFAFADTVKIQGQVNGFSDSPPDDTLMGAVVIPSIRGAKLVSLQLSDFIAPNEKMSAGPSSVSVPGNLFVPSQDESFSGFPITVSKPDFSCVLENGVKNELAAVSFQGTFSTLVDMAQNKSPLSKMLPYVKLGAMGFQSDRDWSSMNSTPSLTLDQNAAPTLNYAWNRDDAGDGAADVVMSFQKTPAKRLMISDMISPVPASGQIKTFSMFDPSAKVAFVRLYDSTAQDDIMPAAMVGYVRDIGARGSTQVTGVPAQLTGTSVTGDNRVVWDAVHQTGWVAVLRSTATLNLFETEIPRHPFLSGLMNGLLPNISVRIALPNKLEGWADPASGFFQLSTPLGGDKIDLVYIGTDRAVPAPATDPNSDAEPALLTYANEIRFVRIP